MFANLINRGTQAGRLYLWKTTMWPTDYLCRAETSYSSYHFYFFFTTSPFGPGSETFQSLPEMTKADDAVSDVKQPSGARAAPHVSPVQLKQHYGPCHFLPFLPFPLACARSLAHFFPDLLMSAERQRDSFPCLKIQASQAVSTVDRFTRQKWAPFVKYSKGAEQEVSGCSFFSFSFFCFLGGVGSLGIAGRWVSSHPFFV